MGAPTASEVLVGSPATGTGGILTAPLGTALPGGVNATPNVAFVDAGYIGDDGVTITENRETTDVFAWGGSKVRVVQSSHSLQISFPLLETTEDSVSLVRGADNVSSTADGFKAEVTADVLPHRAFIIDAQDGERGVRIEISDGQIISVGDQVLVHSDATRYEVTVECFPDEDGVKATFYYEDIDDGS